LEKLVSNGSLRASLAGGAAALARTEFDPIKIRRRFIGLLQGAAAGGQFDYCKDVVW
jgi:hypothetical protein